MTLPAVAPPSTGRLPPVAPPVPSDEASRVVLVTAAREENPVLLPPPPAVPVNEVTTMRTDETMPMAVLAAFEDVARTEATFEDVAPIDEGTVALDDSREASDAADGITVGRLARGREELELLCVELLDPGWAGALLTERDWLDALVDARLDELLLFDELERDDWDERELDELDDEEPSLAVASCGQPSAVPVGLGKHGLVVSPIAAHSVNISP